MIKILLPLIILLFFSVSLFADVVVEPADLSVILKKISLKAPHVPLGLSARIIIKNGSIIFLQKPGAMSIATSFSDDSPSIVKQINLTNNLNGDDYAFAAILKNNGQAFEREVKKLNGQDALVFFNDRDVFVYTQTAASNGAIELKEWIYARKPNNAQGSQWTWTFKSVTGQWPLTLGLADNGQAVVYRNVPFSGIPITMQARSNYMLNAMVKFTQKAHVEKYFPYHEIVSAIPPAQFWTREGIQRDASIGISNSSVFNPNTPTPSADVNFFSAWDKYWQSEFEVSITARPAEYPLLIDPSLDISLPLVGSVRERDNAK